jgi:hypothetical protein
MTHVPAFSHRVIAAAAALVCFSTSLAARAEDDPAKRDKLRATSDEIDDLEQGPSRPFTIQIAPMSLFIGRWGAGATWVPFDHHALTENIFYYDQKTDPQVAPPNRFQGIGGEVGYRYYTGLGGPRGMFGGPSLLLGGYTVSPAYGANVAFQDLGIAFDVGYEALVADRVMLLAGVGAQYMYPTKSLPQQTDYEDSIANRKFLPRFLLEVGWAL